ncbi:uncharacterized protein RCO7_07595 [Rhynchosporium graminicola]|uniref:Piwi domain-containing protein n=1 Tax=Rhynchosporium graminicola TaxID=2792576 RepID=A0A1E1KZR4_9HELO|nr:uncharacterized protein RCO7_07595 [Rhynchosporium commune]
MPQIIAGRQNAFNEIKAVSTHTNVIPHTFKYKLGTVVDSDVVTPNHVNFYLQAHASPKGTVRSAHCNVLKDTCGHTGACATKALSLAYDGKYPEKDKKKDGGSPAKLSSPG